jgi:two-component system response regulator RegA
MANLDLASNPTRAIAPPVRGRLLIVENDRIQADRLAEEMRARGFVADTAGTLEACLAAVARGAPDYVLVDVRLGNENGLEAVSAVHAAHPAARIVIHSCHGTLATVVAAIKAGAADCLPKPISMAAIEAALLSQREPLPLPVEVPLNPDWVRWEHIQRVFAASDGNVSRTARKLRMHRRTLQRILAKGEPGRRPRRSMTATNGPPGDVPLPRS